jgi:NADPH:quinone reductase-like Zn-dependent oxidoreductase
VRATGVNPVDWKSAARRASGPAPAAGSPPVVPGRDIAGVIDALGADVTGWKRGDRVLVFTPGGGYAQYAVVPASIVAAAPRKFSFRESAGLPLVAETAWRSLFEAADLKSGQRALIHGGAGGVGSAAVQLAKARGAYVIATASPRNHDYLRSIGADEVIDYKTVRFEQVVKDVDIVLNTVDADTGMRSIGVLRKGGTLVSVVGPPPADLVAAAGVRATAPVRDGKGLPVAQLLAEVVALADAGKYRVNVDQAFPLAEAARAWDAGRTNRTRGKLVIDLPE